MTWAPTKQVIDLSGVVDNLLGYIETNQADAHLWANGEPLDDYKALYPNATGRLSTKFPHLIVLDQEHKGEDGETDGGEVLVIHLALTLEGAITGPNADDLVLKAKKYVTALESMLINIPSATLTGSASIHGSPMGYQTAYDILKGHGGKTAANWLQIFQTRCEYRLITSAF